MSSFTIRRSAIDEERFGVRTARADRLTLDDYPQVQQFCADHAVQLCIVRLSSDELRLVQRLEADGYRLMDTMTYYLRDLTKKPLPASPTDAYIRLMQPGDREAILEIGRVAFQNYQGHYHADPRLPQDKCDETYADWTRRELAESDVLVAELHGEVVGFLTMRQNSDDEVQVMLGAVSPAAHGHGIYHSILSGSLAWGKEQNASRVLYATQITNVAVQKVLVRVGFEINRSAYTLHKWFDAPQRRPGVS